MGRGRHGARATLSECVGGPRQAHWHCVPQAHRRRGGAAFILWLVGKVNVRIQFKVASWIKKSLQSTVSPESVSVAESVALMSGSLSTMHTKSELCVFLRSLRICHLIPIKLHRTCTTVSDIQERCLRLRAGGLTSQTQHTAPSQTQHSPAGHQPFCGLGLGPLLTKFLAFWTRPYRTQLSRTRNNPRQATQTYTS